MLLKRMQRLPGFGALSERQERILARVVDLYVETAGPVSSQAVSRSARLDLSSATLRNEMAELEDQGLLSQPHTSSGRVPTAQGFRYYLDHLVRPRSLPFSEKESLRAYSDLGAMTGQESLRETSRVLSVLSHCAGVVVLPRLEHAVLRSLHFMPLRHHRLLAVLITASGRVEQRVLPDRGSLTPAELSQVSNCLQPLARGRTLLELRDELDRQLQADRDACDRILVEALTLSRRLLEDDPALGWYINGQSNILDQPEFSDLEAVKRLFQALEEKSLMIRLVDEAIQAEGPQVILGDERRLPALKDTALVMDRYLSEGADHGCVGVIGPLRMNYARVIPLVQYAAGVITEFLKG